jgi:nucleotide-binding universal stress UspA family protein
MFKKILHANDGSEPAFHAFQAALALAKQNRAELHMISVEEIMDFAETIGEIENDKDGADRKFRDVKKRARDLAEKAGVKLHVHVTAGHPVRSIIESAQTISADLLVIGAKGHSAFYERMVGSRADRLVQLSPCAVLVVK